MLLTYNRLEYAKTTLISTLANLKTVEDIHVHIGSDGDTDGYIGELISIAEHYAPVTVSNTGGKSYGASYNAATQVVHNLAGCEYVLVLEDDWELRRTLNISPILRVLSDRVFGCVRMGYIGYTQSLKCSFVSHADCHWLSLDPESPEPHIFAGHPRIETVAWHL